MAVSTFDTLNAMRGLEAAGIHPKQAEAITNAVRDAVMEGTATKGDILRVDNDIKTGFTSVNGKVDALATETRAEFERLSDKIDSLATKATVDALATKIRADIERLSDKIEPLATKAMVDAIAKELKADIARLETRMMMTAIIVGGVVIAAIKYL